MIKIKKNSFSVFGNPITHSRSPKIHDLFSKNTGIVHHYSAIHVPLGKIENVLGFFFSHGGKGGNITLPFKEKALNFCHQLTEIAEISGAVNTLKRLKNGKILGENTDGIGILNDLKRLKFIKNKYNILIFGAGGAAKGIILPLLLFGSHIFITNRDMNKAEDIEKKFKNFGKITSVKLDNFKKKINLIINATSSGIYGLSPVFPDFIVSSDTYCYDISYHPPITPFLSRCRDLGAINVANGIGMLVSQAAYSFFLWHGILPEVIPVINFLNIDNK
ncbi:Shikimate dehydrogenase (NADP(+)) [Buchnera aphidicola (Pemphigus immunis)]